MSYDELTVQVTAWQEAFPDLVRLQSLGTTPEGRSIWLLVIGPDPDRVRPAAWVDGNLHASEVAGSSVALAIAEEVLRAHVEPRGAADLPTHLIDLVRKDVLFYVVPRICPDGAEAVLSLGRWVRSNPRDERLGRSAPYWRVADVDGDGRALLMRREDPAGDFVASAEFPDLMLPRRIEDVGPFYTLFPEGLIENWDGFDVPMPDMFSDNAVDMNRNFPYGWKPEPDQLGAGAYPGSEPESRAIIEFAERHPNIFAWLDLHTFGGVYIRPCGDRIDKKMTPSDLELYHQLEAWAREFSGYPMVSGFEEFTYEPDKPLCGDLSTYAYHQRGAVGMVCELWDFWSQAGLEVLRPHVWNFQRRTREDAIAIARWDREHNRGRIVGSWKRCEHPQLGAVDVGGFDPRFGIWNPPPERLAEVCDAQVRFFLRLASLAPRVRLTSIETTTLGHGVTRVRAVVENLGYLPTHVLASARGLPWNEPVRATIALGEGVELLSASATHRLGHLGGWGGYEKLATAAYARSAGEVVRARVEWLVKGHGGIEIRAESTRIGCVRESLAV